MKLFLASAGVPRPDLLKKLMDVKSDGARVALINNAQDPYPEEIANQRGVLLVETFNDLGFQPVPIDLRSFEGRTTELMEVLQTCKLIWCSGGNAFWLRSVMKKSGFDQIIHQLLEEGIVYGGWSAGVVITGPSLKPIDLMDDPNVVSDIVWEGLGLVEFFIWPHWGKEKYLHLQDSAMEQMKLLPYESIKLEDDEVIIVEDDQRKIVK